MKGEWGELQLSAEISFVNKINVYFCAANFLNNTQTDHNQWMQSGVSVRGGIPAEGLFSLELAVLPNCD